MAPPKKIRSLEDLLARLSQAAKQEERVAVGNMVEVIGHKSFGPLLLLPGLIVLSPLSGVPGLPTLMALMVFLTAGQLLCGRKHFWLPQWLMRRSVTRERYEKTLRRLEPAARFLDRFFHPRLTALTKKAGTYFVAAICALIALAMPPMELVPFAASIAGGALTAFGLSLITHDGLMTLIAVLLTGAVIFLAVQALL